MPKHTAQGREGGTSRQFDRAEEVMAPHSTGEPAARVGRLKQRFYRTADTLHHATYRRADGWTWNEYPHATDEERAEIVRRVTSLAASCGIDPAKYEVWNRVDRVYIDSIKARGGTDEGSPDAQALANLAGEIDDRWTAAVRKERDEPKRKPGARFTVGLGGDDDTLCAWGFMPGDTLTFEEGDDIRPGEVTGIHLSDGGVVGRLVSLDGETLIVTDEGGEASEYALAGVERFGRIVSLTRAFKRPEPAAMFTVAGHRAPVVHLSAWRQSHPRPLRAS